MGITTLSDSPSNEEKQWIQVNPSCLLAYLGIRGYANTPSSGTGVINKNALPILTYFDIFKNYHANTQEENFYIIGTSPKLSVNINGIVVNNPDDIVESQGSINPTSTIKVIASGIQTNSIRLIVKQNTTQEEPSPTDPTTHEIYTSIRLKNNTWHIRQECEGIQIGTPGTYPLDKCPWIPLRLYRSEEEDYGRGYVEQYYGSLHALSVLSEAILAAAAAASKVIFLVRPSATTKIESLVRAENLSFVQGKADDIDILQIEKYNPLPQTPPPTKSTHQ